MHSAMVGLANPEPRLQTPHVQWHGPVILPARVLPAWGLPLARKINTAHLTFDTNLANMSVPELYLAPECVRDYRLLGRKSGGDWAELAVVEGNYQRKRIHRFPALETDAVWLEVAATIGDRSARLYELRLYNERQEGEK